MTQYKTSDVKLSISQLNKLKSGIKYGTEVNLNLSWNIISDSNDETNVPYKLFLNDSKVSKLRQAIANGSSANIKLSKTQLSNRVQLGGSSIFSSVLNLVPMLNPVASIESIASFILN